MDLLLVTVVLLLTVVICLPLFKSYRKSKAIASLIDTLPGPRKYPVIGTALEQLKTNRESYFDSIKGRHRVYGPIFRTWLGSKNPMVHLYKADHLQILFKSQANIDKGHMYQFLVPWLGQGLVVGTGKHWKHHRTVITPAFHFKMLDKYSDIFSEKARQLADTLGEHVGKGYFDVTPYLTKVALDVIAESAMGVKINFLDNPHSEYANAIIKFGTSMHKRMYNPIYSNDFLFKFTKFSKELQTHLDVIHRFNRKVIEERRSKFEKTKANIQKEDDFGIKHRMVFLDVLLANQEMNNFTDQDIEDEVNTFMFGGQDTTASTVGNVLMALGNFPEIQQKVHKELDEIFEGSDRRITPLDVANMNYLDRVIKEVLRLYVFIPFLGRQLVNEMVIDGYRIPAGVTVVMSLLDLHLDPEQFPDPLRFDPDRFLPEQVNKRHPFAYAPFSAGARNCIGQKFGMRSSKTLIAQILRKYVVKCLEKPENIKYYWEVVLRPQNGLHLSLESR